MRPFSKVHLTILRHVPIKPTQQMLEGAQKQQHIRQVQQQVQQAQQAQQKVQQTQQQQLQPQQQPPPEMQVRAVLRADQV